MDEVNNKTTENIKAKLKYSSTKAYFIEFYDGRHKWIPQSIVHNTIDLSNTEDEQCFSVEWWFVDRYQLY